MIKLNDKAYDIMKWLVMILIPAATTMYVAVDSTFGWGFSDTVATISAALCTFLGAILGISTAEYNRSKDE